MLTRGLGSAVVQLRPDLIEAYIRAGRREEAEAVLERLDADADAAGAASVGAGERGAAGNGAADVGAATGGANDRGAAANGGADVGAASGERVAGESGPGEAGATANGAANVAGEAGAATGDTNDRGVAASGAAGGPRWAAAAAARCRALLAPDEDFRGAFEVALALHDDLPMPFERARTLLALGERLRRAKQRAEAREPLTAALDAFERLGARPWAERARTELRATGGQASGRRAQAAAEQLTPHELQIAVLVAQGMTNREAAAALFLSPKTIEYHLGQIYRKLDVRGRAQLARLMAMELPDGERDPSVLADALS